VPRAPEDLAAAAARAGGLTIASSRVAAVGAAGDVVVTRMTFTDPWAAARLLFELAKEDAADPEVRAWALAIVDSVVAAHGDPPGPMIPPEVAADIGPAIVKAVQENVRFVHEPKETFQSASVTMRLGYGDCDDHARLVYALARAAGLPATIVFLERDEQPVHVVAKIAGDWAETTLPADYGEDPIDAYLRVQETLPPEWNPLASPAGDGTIERVPMGGTPTTIGFLGLEFVTPQDVRDYKGELNTHVTTLDADVVHCVQGDPAGTKLDTATLDAWNQFVAEWRTFMADDPGFFSAGGQGRLANNYAHTIAEWEERITQAGCGLSGPRVVLPADDPVLGTIKTVAIAGAVVAGAFGLWELSQYVPKPRAARRRAA
jgi:hypothetical protein